MGKDHHSDGERHRYRDDPGADRLRADVDLRHHGRGQLCPRRALHAGCLCGSGRPGDERQLLGRARRLHARHRAPGCGHSSDHAASAARPRSPDHHSGHLRRIACAAELRPLAVRAGGAQDPGAVHRLLHALLSRLSVVSAANRGALRRHHRRLLAVPQIRKVRHLDPRHHAGPRHGTGHGHPGAVGSHRSVRHRRRHGRCQRRAVRSAGRGQPYHGSGLDIEGFHRGCRRGHGQPRRVHCRLHLHQPAGSLCLDLGEPGAGGDRLLRGSHPDLAVPSHRPVRTDPKMSKRPTTVYWTGFCIILALLIVAPLVLPEFWRRFLTEILIWGLLAMSSDILIGYTGMVSFGHSAFFGLGMYGAAAALLMVRPPNLWLAIAYGLIGSAGVALFVAYFSTRLRDIYFAITTLIFSQIFYVIIFTWTEVTGGENGLSFRRPPLAIPGLFSMPFTSETLHWFVLAVVTASYLILRRITQSPFGMVLQSIRENEARTRAIGYPVERYKIVAVMLSGLFAGLAGVLYAIQNRFAA